MSNWLGVFEGIVAGTVPTVGLLYTYLANIRSQYDRVLALTAESGMPPVSEDRHVAGLAFEPLSKHVPGQVVRLSEAEIKAVFDVLWYFERVDALYLSLRPALGPGRIIRTQALLLDSLGSSVSSWTPYLALKWVNQADHLVDAADTTGPLRHLAAERVRLASRRTARNLGRLLVALLARKNTHNGAHDQRHEMFKLSSG